LYYQKKKYFVDETDWDATTNEILDLLIFAQRDKIYWAL
jgi:hypothetical protein